MPNGKIPTFFNNPFPGFPNSATSFLPLEINRPGSDYRELLIKSVSENLHYIMLLTQEEAYAIVKELAPVGEYDISERDLDRLGFGATYAGNAKDGMTTSKIIWKLKSFGVAAQIYRARNGEQMVKITGYAGIRRILVGTNYKLRNMQIVNIGIGQKGINTNIVSGMKFCIYAGLAYRTLEFLLRDSYSTEEFLGKVTSDMAKVIVTAMVMKAVATIAMGIASVSIGLAILVVVVIGALFTYSLDLVDDKYSITDTVIKKITEMERNAPRINELWGRDSQLLSRTL